MSIESKLYVAVRVTCDGCGTVALDYDTDHDWHFYSDDGDLTAKPVMTAVPCMGCLDDWDETDDGLHLCPDCRVDPEGAATTTEEGR